MMKNPSLTSILKLSLGSHSMEDMTFCNVFLFCIVCEWLLRYLEKGIDEIVLSTKDDKPFDENWW